RLYYDLDGDGAADYLFAATNTGASGSYTFTNLPDGNFVVAVDVLDSDLPFGYTPTTPTSFPIALDPARTNVNPVVDWTADFGFAPALTLVKTRTSTNAVREGQLISYHLTVSNSLPGDGTGQGMPATYYAWASTGGANYKDTEWVSYSNAFYPPGPDGLYTSNQFAGPTTVLSLTNFTVGAQLGEVTNVSLVIPIAIAPPIGGDDTVTIDVLTRSPSATRFTQTYLATSLVSGVWTVPMTGTYDWVWADFDTNAVVTLTAKKNAGGTAGGWLLVDAVGFEIESDQITGVAGGTTTLDPVPLVDRYDPARLQFVSAQPPESSVETVPTGTIHWDNVGPIYPGGTSTVAVTFKLLEPPNNTNAVVTNTTWVTNAYFQGGAHANNATSSVVVTQFPAATVGDYVWRDLNGDGVQDAGEPGVPNVAVSITPPVGIDLGNGLGAAITNWTDANGLYLFESIPATGVYTVRVVTATLPGGTGVNTYDERGAYDSTAAIYLNVYTNGTNNLHLTTDFGYTLPSTIEGTIWHDWDRGQETYREAGEDWMTNVTVYLCASPSPCGPGASIATNVTTTNGYFRFTGNFNGTYTVYVATNSGMLGTGSWKTSWDTDGTNTANYSAVTVPAGGTGRADFSYFKTGPYRIGDTVFYDWNSNGVQNVESEGGISNVTVWLYEDANGDGVVNTNTDAFIATTVTATNGYYLFTNLFATNTYLVVVDRQDPDLPANAIVTADPDAVKDARSVVTIVNADNFDQDFGFWPYGNGAIGDTVWKDVNADGVQSGYQETGISNVLVTLYHEANGTWWPLRSTNTDANGHYLFDSLPDGNYRVVVDDADADLPVDAFGNVYYPSTPVFHDATISGGSTDLDADFGFAPYGAIGDTVFWDIGRNGDQDFNDPGVPGVEVRLYADANANGIYDAGETLLATDTTDADGRYLFDRLLPGRYAVFVVTASGPLLGADQTADPQSDGLTCDDPLLTVPCDDQCGWALAPAQIFLGADFGYAPRGVIGDTLWVDANDNGVRDEGELGIPYVDVILYSNGVAIATNATDADGYYGFSGLVDFANYGVRAATNDVDFPAGLVNVWTADGTFDNYTTNVVMSGGAVTSIGGYPCTDCDLNVDFGYRYAGSNSLSGTIGLDATPYDGLMNGLNPSGPGAGESPYAGVPVTLYLWNDDGDGVIEAGETTQIGTETTDDNGDYAFTGLPAGDGNDKYVVASPAPESSLTLTTTNGSIAGVTVFTTTNLQGYAVSARLAVNVAPTITNMDFAYSTTTLYDYGDLPDSYDTLLADGARHVVPLTPNLYLGAGVDTEQNGVPSVGADGDDLAGTDDEDGVLQITNSIWQVGTEGGSVEVTVGAGSGWLLGYIDFNGDGDFVDAGEMVCNLAVSNTGGNGAGVYTNAFAVPADTFSTTSSTPLYARFRLYPEQPLFPELAYAGTADNGEVEDYLWHLAGLGDTVWYDVDGDGVQDAGEPPIPGVRVFADLNADGVWQTTEPAATTDGNGLYGIGGLVPGTYSVVVDASTLPAGVTPTYDLDGIGTPHQASVEITALDQFVSTVDFGYAPPVDIGDRVWFDANRDGIQNVAETNGLYQIPVALLDTNGNVVAETQTDSQGNYLFANMPTGTYLVRFDLAVFTTNEMLSPSKVGSDDALDNDWVSGNASDYAWTAPFSVSGGEDYLDVDLGVATRSPTRAELAAVWGEWTDGAGRVVWRTDSEYSTAGFFLSRVDPETSAETRLNERLAPAAFSEGGATYALADPAARAGEEQTYRLEEV
ncbi:MAG: SdrD B-like domain-containing protein, partial [Kiritimatiellia bacterium]